MARRTVEVLPPESEVKALVELRPDLLQLKAQEVAEIVLAEDAEKAGLFLRIVRMQIRSIEAKYKRLREDINAAIKKNREEEAEEVRRWKRADEIVSKPLDEWVAAENQRVEAENKRRLAEAEELAKAQQKVDADILRAAAANAETATERKALERQARQVEKAQPMPVLKTPAVEAPKIAGVSQTTKKVGVIVDPVKFLRAILDGKIPFSAILYNQAFIDKQANDLGDLLNWPGVAVQEKTHLSTRGL